MCLLSMMSTFVSRTEAVEIPCLFILLADRLLCSLLGAAYAQSYWLGSDETEGLIVDLPHQNALGYHLDLP